MRSTKKEKITKTIAESLPKIMNSIVQMSNERLLNENSEIFFDVNDFFDKNGMFKLQTFYYEVQNSHEEKQRTISLFLKETFHQDQVLLIENYSSLEWHLSRLFSQFNGHACSTDYAYSVLVRAIKNFGQKNTKRKELYFTDQEWMKYLKELCYSFYYAKSFNSESVKVKFEKAIKTKTSFSVECYSYLLNDDEFKKVFLDKYGKELDNIIPNKDLLGWIERYAPEKLILLKKLRKRKRLVP